MAFPFPRWWTVDALPPSEEVPAWGLGWVEWVGSEPQAGGEAWLGGSPLWLQARARQGQGEILLVDEAGLLREWESRLAKGPAFVGDEAWAFLAKRGLEASEGLVPLREALGLLQPMEADKEWGEIAEAPSPAPEAGLLRAQWYGHLLLALLGQRSRWPEALRATLGRLLKGARHPLAVGLPAADRFPWEELAELYGRRLRQRVPPSTFGQEEEPLSPSIPLDVDELAALLSPGGPIAQAHPNYEHREGQIRMALAAARAFNEERLLMVEAGTGTGKTMAYLLPALLWIQRNGERVVISTNTKNLQDQLFRKDLPFLQKVLGLEVRAELLKGRNNYLCVQRLLDELREEDLFAAPAARRILAYLLLWAWFHPTGDLEELSPFWLQRYPSLGPYARSLASEGDFCLGSLGREHPCFGELARRRAQAAGLLVINHALAMAHFANQVLPPFQRLIFDEAHNLEEAVTNFLGLEVSRRGMEQWLQQITGSPRALLARLQRYVAEEGSVVGLNALGEAATRCLLALEEFTLALYRWVRRRAVGEEDLEAGVRWRLREAAFWEDTTSGLKVAKENLGIALTRWVRQLAQTLQDLTGEAERWEFPESLMAQLQVAVQRGGEMLEAWEAITQLNRNDFVYWLEFQQRNGRVDWLLRAAPIETGPLLAQEVYAKMRTVILTSATLTIARRFDYFQERLGVEGAQRETETLRIPSHFPYEELVLLGVPSDMALPESQGFEEQVARFLYHLIQQIGGRTLVLFTSHKSLRYVYERSREAIEGLGVEVLCQGQERSRHQLTERFREGRPAILMGTRSFWEGIDVPGEALQCVVLVKLPFPVPNDPIVQARTEALNAQGRNGYLEYYEPQAIIQFQQGFGRLVRTAQDRGAVLVLDRRLLLRPYGRRFLASVPGYRLFVAPAREVIAQTRIWLEEGEEKRWGKI